jgi:hypothetical protein
MFLSAHYAGDDLSPKFTNGEYWKKVHGPIFMYLNSSWDASDPTMLWEDAKVQVIIFLTRKCSRIVQPEPASNYCGAAYLYACHEYY